MNRYIILCTAALNLLGFSAIAATHYVDANGTNAVPPFIDWTTAATNIQNAVDVAGDGEMVLVTNGVYSAGGRAVSLMATNRVVIAKAITVQSANGPGVTTIEGYFVGTNSAAYSNDVRCVYMTNSCVLSGFTVANGGMPMTGNNALDSAVGGGGIYCGSTNSVVTNCIITGCTGLSSGGGVFGGTLLGCTISNNVGLGYIGAPGGGVCQSTLYNCLVISNTADWGGGAANSTLVHCSVIGNTSPYVGTSDGGGGMFLCVANGCLIANNTAAQGGGGDFGGILTDCVLSNNFCGFPNPGQGGGSRQDPAGFNVHPMLNNCLVVSNYCNGTGGGVYSKVNLFATNCTVTGNTATNFGGGVYLGTFLNSIIYGNHSTAAFPMSSNVGGTTLINSWTNDPFFVNAAAGDYHLQSNSPCINSGNNAYVSVTNDLDGNPRIVGGTVDMGAYEYQTPVSTISYAWLQQYALPIVAGIDTTDSDGTGMNNWQKWIAGLNPTNPASVLAMTTLSNNAGGIKVVWKSVNTRSYYLQRGTSLSASPIFSSIQSNIVGQAGTTSFTDSSATNGMDYFYRVGVQ